MILELSPTQLGFELEKEMPAEMTPEDEKDVSKVEATLFPHELKKERLTTYLL